ncbi:hypothetical protein [Nostoc sp. UHCC 0870]|uniref:hypothetical protein n=1 Tax=Nostoc sp. UHCC 0870 TaxID=2914041 RepID=UPI001EDD4AFE|nr:hypothetical protein [Nostoc sp. UHCC 0870]UKO98756.1 hypothetical protein L6494_03205 [Nostoc sp. UHCC 0870]
MSHYFFSFCPQSPLLLLRWNLIVMLCNLLLTELIFQVKILNNFAANYETNLLLIYLEVIPETVGKSEKINIGLTQ